MFGEELSLDTAEAALKQAQENDALPELPPNTGIAPRAVLEVFRILEERASNYTHTVTLNMFQLYRDNLQDLLCTAKHPPKLMIKLAEHTKSGLVEVEGSVTCVVSNPMELQREIQRGSANRATSATLMNCESSRSHLVAMITIRSTNSSNGNVVTGKLTLVDLAGSERVNKSGASGDTLKEAQSINKSLSALGDVINALTTNAAHVPYRNHPLTSVMSDSLGGNAKTLMLVCASPADYNHLETTNSLNFATRCKSVVNAASAVSGAELRNLKKELAKLKKLGKKNAPTELTRPAARRVGSGAVNR
jgi:hypothetical protein